MKGLQERVKLYPKSCGYVHFRGKVLYLLLFNSLKNPCLKGGQQSPVREGVRFCSSN